MQQMFRPNMIFNSIENNFNQIEWIQWFYYFKSEVKPVQYFRIEIQTSMVIC